MNDTLRIDLNEFASRLRGDWPDLGGVSDRASGRIAIVGQTGAGKKTLVNSLWGWPALEDDGSPVSIHKLGLFTMVTPPETDTETADLLYQLESADLLVYLIDATEGPQDHDVRWIARLRALPPAMLVALTKVDQLEDAPSPEDLAELQDQFARPVIALNASDTRAVHEQLLPMALKLCPQLAVPLAAEITALRWKIVRQLIQESAIKTGLASLENGTTIDLPELLDLQRRLTRQIARVYGYGEQDESLWSHWVGLGQHALLHYAAQSLSRFGSLGNKLAVALVSMSGTWALGQQANSRYNGAGPRKRFRVSFSRNGHHDSPAPHGG